MKKFRATEGFTLVETLITLFISSLLLFLPVLAVDDLVESREIDLFFRELNANIILMQNHAIIAGEHTRVEFSPKTQTVNFRVLGQDNHPLNREMAVGKSCQFTDQRFQTVHFKADTGNVWEMYGSWRTQFKTKKGIYELVFKLGSGRFDLRKL